MSQFTVAQKKKTKKKTTTTTATITNNNKKTCYSPTLRLVRVLRTCDLELEMVNLGLLPRVAFSRPWPQFFTIRTDSKPTNSTFIQHAYIL